MSETTDPLAWTAKAEEDYTMARLALRQKTPLTGSACFHAQQCVEKYLKAALVAKGLAFPKTHDLVALNDLCMQAGVFLAVAPDQLADLSRQAVQVRYPGEDPAPEEAKEAYEIAKRVRRFVRKSVAIT